jgi:hypothetical protein
MPERQSATASINVRPSQEPTGADTWPQIVGRVWADNITLEQEIAALESLCKVATDAFDIRPYAMA